MHRANILSVGAELVSGQTVDTNASWLAQRLGERGLEVGEIALVGDDEELIASAIGRLAADCDVLLVTGGLGPTADDRTRQGLARVLGVELELREELVEAIRGLFISRKRRMPESNRLQAMIPKGAEALPNEVGTAPGVRAAIGRATVFVLPGVPTEMKRMFDACVAPALASWTGQRVILSKTLRCFGAGESDMGELIADLMERGRSPTVGITAQEAVMGVRIRAAAASRQEAEDRLRETEAVVRQRLADLVFGEGDETLADAVARLLWACGQTLSVAESCTGGLLAKWLTDVPGSSRYFLEGVVTYADAAKVRLLGVPGELIARYGAVSEAVAEAMAAGSRQRSGSDLALATTGIAGPGGGTADKPVGLVYLALAHGGGCVVRDVRLGSHLTRDQVRDRAAKSCLNLLRRHLMRQAASGAPAR